MILSNKEYKEVWDRVYAELKFKPSCDCREHIFTGNLPFEIDKFYVVYGIENMNDEFDKMDDLVRNAFIECTQDGDMMYALDWHHTSFLYNPRIDIEQKDLWIEDLEDKRGGYNAFFPPFYPDGDYYFFIEKDFKFGYLSHPWRQEIWIFGEDLIKCFEKIYKKLNWSKLKQNFD